MSPRWAPNHASRCSRSGCRADLEARWVAELVTGLVSAARAARVQLVGGNISRAPMLFVDVTVSGAVKPRHLLRRSGARPGDELYVSGTVGAAAAGLAWLAIRESVGPALRAGHRRKALIRTLLIPETARSENGPYHRQSRQPSPAIDDRRHAWPSASRSAATRRPRPAWTPATASPTPCASLPGPAASVCAWTQSAVPVDPAVAELSLRTNGDSRRPHVVRRRGLRAVVRGAAAGAPTLPARHRPQGPADDDPDWRVHQGGRLPHRACRRT